MVAAIFIQTNTPIHTQFSRDLLTITVPDEVTELGGRGGTYDRLKVRSAFTKDTLVLIPNRDEVVEKIFDRIATRIGNGLEPFQPISSDIFIPRSAIALMWVGSADS